MDTLNDDDAFDFNEFDTDERINSEIIQFDLSFPDPLFYCLGFHTVPLKENLNP